MEFSSSCDPSNYYPSGKPLGTHSVLHKLLKDTHVRVIPYTSSSKVDAWDGLRDLDKSGSSDVHLIYRDTPMAADLQGDTKGWNREHLWPKSYGVGYTGPDFSDLHHLRPADWGVNAARGNKLCKWPFWGGEGGGEHLPSAPVSNLSTPRLYPPPSLAPPSQLENA